MRVLYLALAVLMIMITVVYLGRVTTWPSLSIPNPLNAKLSINAQGVINVYVTALELNAVGNYTGAMSILRALGVTSAVKALPLINQLHAHEYRLTNYLAELGVIYNNVINSLSMGNYSGARSLAIEGLLMDGEAYGELNAILSIVGSAAPGVAGQVINSTQLIRQYLVSLNETFLNVLAGNYTGTELTITATPSTVFIGGPVTVYGMLTTVNGTPIPNATVSVYVNNAQVGSAVTNDYGAYSLNFTMPWIYADAVNVSVVYNPPPGSNYLPSSNSTTVDVVFDRTVLTVNYTGYVLWGGSISISGYVSGPPDRPVIISIDGLNMSVSSVSNVFSASVNTANMTPGNYSMIIYAPPIGPYSPAYFIGSVVIQPIYENVTVSMNHLVIAGLPIVINGFVSPWVGNVSLTLSFDGESMHLNLSSPNFTVSIPTSILLSTGRHYVVVSMNSSPPVMGVTYAYGVLVLNIVEVVIPIIIIVALFLLVRLGFIQWPSAGGLSTAGAKPQGGAVGLVIRRDVGVKALREEIARFTPSGKISIENVRRIIDVLAGVIYVIGNRTGVRLRSTSTLREYLASVRGKLSEDDAAVLEELIMLAERALYSPYVPSDVDVERAWQLSQRFTQ